MSVVTGRSRKWRFRAPSFVAALSAAVIAGAVLGWPQAGEAGGVGPFAGFVGAWRGGGQIKTASGRSETINCRARYQVSESGATLTQALVCAGDSFRLNIDSTVIADGSSVSGSWQETNYSISGNLTGQIVGGVFQGVVDGPGLSAAIVLRTSGRQQAVDIRPNAGDIAEVVVTLKKEASAS